MNSYDVKRLGLLSAIRVEVDGMIAENTERVMRNKPLLWHEPDFQAKAEEIRKLSYCHDQKL